VRRVVSAAIDREATIGSGTPEGAQSTPERSGEPFPPSNRGET
jgi:hypothetical protein